MKSQKKKVFVEIGVCDFDTLEPLLDNGWEGYFVEPIQEYAEKLSHLNMTNCAISNSDGTVKMYKSNQTNQWSKGISHIVKQQGECLLEKAGNKKYLDKIITCLLYTSPSPRD